MAAIKFVVATSLASHHQQRPQQRQQQHQQQRQNYGAINGTDITTPMINRFPTNPHLNHPYQQQNPILGGGDDTPATYPPPLDDATTTPSSPSRPPPTQPKPPPSSPAPAPTGFSNEKEKEEEDDNNDNEEESVTTPLLLSNEHRNVPTRVHWEPEEPRYIDLDAYVNDDDGGDDVEAACGCVKGVCWSWMRPRIKLLAYIGCSLASSAVLATAFVYYLMEVTGAV